MIPAYTSCSMQNKILFFLFVQSSFPNRLFRFILSKAPCYIDLFVLRYFIFNTQFLVLNRLFLISPYIIIFCIKLSSKKEIIICFSLLYRFGGPRNCVSGSLNAVVVKMWSYLTTVIKTIKTKNGWLKYDHRVMYKSILPPCPIHGIMGEVEGHIEMA